VRHLCWRAGVWLAGDVAEGASSLTHGEHLPAEDAAVENRVTRHDAQRSDLRTRLHTSDVQLVCPGRQTELPSSERDPLE
jgi:hypothetical protein